MLFSTSRKGTDAVQYLLKRYQIAFVPFFKGTKQHQHLFKRYWYRLVPLQKVLVQLGTLTRGTDVVWYLYKGYWCNFVPFQRYQSVSVPLLKVQKMSDRYTYIMYLSYRFMMRQKGTFMHFKAGPILCTFVKILVPLWRFNIVYGYTKNSTLNWYAHWMCVSDSFIIFKFYSFF